MEKMLKYFISQAMDEERSVSRESASVFRVVLQRLSVRLWRKQHISPEPGKYFSWKNLLRLAIGAGVDITKPFGNLIVDIGAGTTDVAVISVGGVVVSASVKVAGDNFNHAIMNYVREKHSLFIGEDAGRKYQDQNWNSQ